MKKLFLFVYLFCVSAIANAPIELVVPYTPGGAVDIVGRNLQKYLLEQAQISTTVINRPGADGRIGVRYVLGKPPNGSTAIISASGLLVASPVLYKDIEYSYRNFDIVPMVQTPFMISVSNKSQILSMREFVQAGTNKKLNCGVSNSSAALVAKYLVKRLDLQGVELIPFKGSGDLVASMINGTVDCAFDTILSHANAHKDSRIRIIGIASRNKDAEYSNVDLIRDTLPNFVYYNWYGVGFVKDTPEKNKEQIIKLAKIAYLNNAFKQSIKQFGAEVFAPPLDIASWLEQDYMFYENIRVYLGIEKE